MASIHQFMFTLLAREKARANHRFLAVLLDYSSGTIHLAANDPNLPMIGTPIVVLVNRAMSSVGDFSNVSIYSSYTPTAACVGMARMCASGSHVLWVASNKLKSLKVTRGSWTYRTPYIPPLYFSHVFPGSKNAFWADYRVYARGTKIAGSAHEKLLKRLPAAAWTSWTPSRPTFKPSASGAKINLAGVISDRESRDRIFMAAAMEMVEKHWNRRGNRNVSQEKRGWNIGAILVDGDGNIVSWGLNTNEALKSLHAEVNVTLTCDQKKKTLPDKGVLYTTLEPCEMCSGVISQAVKASSVSEFTVVFGYEDEAILNTEVTALKASKNQSGSKLKVRRVSVTDDAFKAAKLAVTTDWQQKRIERQRLLNGLHNNGYYLLLCEWSNLSATRGAIKRYMRTARRSELRPAHRKVRAEDLDEIWRKAGGDDTQRQKAVVDSERIFDLDSEVAALQNLREYGTAFLESRFARAEFRKGTGIITEGEKITAKARLEQTTATGLDLFATHALQVVQGIRFEKAAPRLQAAVESTGTTPKDRLKRAIAKVRQANQPLILASHQKQVEMKKADFAKAHANYEKFVAAFAALKGFLDEAVLPEG